MQCLTKPGADVGDLLASIVAPDRRQCGISDYSRGLNAALRHVSGVEIVREVPFPEPSDATGFAASARIFGKRKALFQKMGVEASAKPAQVVHIQHEFSLFDGAAPYKCQAASFYDALTVPVVLTVHELLIENGHALKRIALKNANRVSFLHSGIKQWIVHTSSDRDKLVAIGASAERVHIIPVPVPEAHTLDRSNVQGLTDRYNLAGRRVVTLFGFISRKKAHADAVEAMQHLPEDTVLIIAGGQHPQDNTDYVPSVRRRIEELGLSNRVIITGFLDDKDVDAIMAVSGAALAPFHSCSGSASVAHLLASGVPVVASDIEPFAEICRDTPAALTLFPVGDVVSLAAAVDRLLGNTEARNHAVLAGQAYARAHTPLAAAVKTAEVYWKVVAS